MTRPGPERIASPETVRRREVERVLAAAGLLPGPRSIGAAAGEDGFVLRLRFVLERLGPVFSAFGLHLASRADLLAAGECLELSTLPDRGDLLPADAFLRLVAGELRQSPREVFAEFDELPCASRLFDQAHRARLLDGRAVIVRALRPGLKAWLERDLPLLTLLGPAFADAGHVRSFFDEAVADFAASLPQALDLTMQAEALGALAAETEGFGPLRAPQVHPSLTTPGLVVFQDLEGRSLEECLPEPDAAAGALARRLCLVWLRQALLGRIVPVEPWGANVTVLADDRIAFTGGAVTKLPSPFQSNLWGYLIAASNQDPEEVCTYLLREMTLEGPPSAEEQLRLRLRQAVPFRDGGWSVHGESLAEHLFLHWRFAREAGFRPRAQLLAFYRGLAAVSLTARRLAPDRDALLQAFEEVRLLSSVQQLGEMMNVGQMREMFERYAALMIDLPQRLDEVLTLAAEGNLRSGSRAPEPAQRPRSTSSTLWVALLLALGAIFLLWPRLDGIWGERLGALVFLLLGALLLRLVVRS